MTTREELEASFEVYQEKSKEKEKWEKEVVRKHISKLFFWLVDKTRWKVWGLVTGILIETMPGHDNVVVRITKRGRLLDEKIFIFDDMDELVKRKIVEKKNKERRKSDG